MGQKLFVPQYDGQAAQEAVKLLRAEAPRARMEIERFKNDYAYRGKVDYGSIAKSVESTMNMVAHFAPQLVESGLGLTVGLSIERRGGFEISAYHPDPKGWIMGYGLAGDGNIGPFQSDHQNDAQQSLDAVISTFKEIDRLLAGSRRERGEPCKCCPEENARSAKAAIEAKDFFAKYLSKGTPMRVEEFRIYNP
ncbi:MAG: hypothetical protein Q7S65_05270 [Nanoarchaeota archaeon]|nr:hypothetical protein [Nanoarchaeota archaeon]